VEKAFDDRAGAIIAAEIVKKMKELNTRTLFMLQ